MISDVWFSKIESVILTILKQELKLDELAPYPELILTNSSQNESLENVRNFPTLYVHLLPLVEMGQDLTNETVNAVRATVELQLYTDDSEQRCRDMIARALLVMKSLHFNIPSFPDPQTSDKKYFAIARCSRVIGGGDKELVPRE